MQACCRMKQMPARAIMWVFAALGTVEPPILALENAKLLENDKPWSKERLPLVKERARVRLGQLSVRARRARRAAGR